MKILFNKFFAEHNKDSLYEGGYRVKDFIDKYPDTNIDFDPMEYILKVHAKEYVEMFKKKCLESGYLAEVDLTPETCDCALLAAGVSILASQNNDFAAVRPAGHHAQKSQASGFCFFNVLAIAAKKLLDEGKKVALLDIDGHRGDGTQAIFEGTENILCISLHQKNVFAGNGPEYTENSMNFPMEAPVKEDTYLENIGKAIDYIRNFGPDVVGISAGFDTYKEDGLLNFELELDTYYKIGSKLSSEFKNIYAVLEGGYHDKIHECVLSFVDGINSNK
jgi:acetoin utilization deacetylase AcuC-like enzyme